MRFGVELQLNYNGLVGSPIQDASPRRLDNILTVWTVPVVLGNPKP